MERGDLRRLERFRSEFRSWLDSNLPARWRGRGALDALPAAERVAALREWQRRLHEGRWLVVHWPEELGGRGGSRLEQAIVHEELARIEAPTLLNGPSLLTVAPAVRTFATPEQQRRYLPKLLSAEEIWRLGVPEPQVGPDLAARETRAERQEDAYRLSGRTLCVATAGVPDLAFVLARTGPESAAVSALVVDLRSPGVAVRPLADATGEATLEEISFDRVPVPVADRIGDENRGREVFLGAAAQECGTAALAEQLQLAGDLDRAIRLAREVGPGGRPAAQDPVLRQRLAQTWIELEILRRLALRNLSALERRRRPTGGWAVSLFAGEVSRRVYEVGLDVLGPYGLLGKGSRRSFDDGGFARGCLLWFGRAITRGGTGIERDLLAEELFDRPRAA